MNKTKKISMSLFAIAIVISFLFVVFCTNHDNSNPLDPEYDGSAPTIINKNTISIDSTTFKASIIDISDNILTLKKSSTLSLSIKRGCIIVSDYGDGVCRYVLNVQESGDALKLSTRVARLDEVIIKGKIDYKAIITPELMKKFSASDSIIPASQSRDSGWF